MDCPQLLKGKTLCVALALFLATLLPALAQKPGTPAPKPIFIARATTPIENEGKPTLDLVDLERYFVDRLIQRRVRECRARLDGEAPKPTSSQHVRR